MRALTRLALLVVLVLVAASCYYGDPGIVTSDGSYGLIGLTADGGDAYHVTGSAVVSSPPSNHGGNTRVGFVVEHDPNAYTEACATWDEHTGPNDQPGVLLAFDGTTALTYTQNIWMGDRRVINLHRWDLSATVDSGQRFSQLGSFTPPVVSDPSWPLRICAHAWLGVVEFKVWHAGQPEPAYGDSCCGAVTLTPTPAGKAGWYTGHLQPGGHLTMSDLTAKP